MQVDKNIRVNEERLWQSLMEMARHGALPNGGCCRLALSDEDRIGRDLFVAWARDAGCEIACDEIGNIYARRPGAQANSAAVATGSHLDTQPHGGKFDGIYGVLAGLEVIRTLNDYNVKTNKACDVIVWTNEEGARFYPPMAGSSVFIGEARCADIHKSRTTDGTTVLDDLRKIGYLGSEVSGSRKFDAFIETHIEQGPILEDSCKKIGIVDRVQGARVYEVQITGEDGHAGTVPLGARKDACTGAAEMILFLNKLGLDTDEFTRMTVGVLEIMPGSISTIPGKARFTIDCRHPDKQVLSSLFNGIEEGLTEIATARNLSIRLDVKMEKSPTEFDSSIVDLLEHVTQQLELPHMRMLSGAGHDAMNLAKVAPTAMIFVPCRDGISHNEREYASSADLAAGADVLLHSMIHRAGLIAAESIT